MVLTYLNSKQYPSKRISQNCREYPLKSILLTFESYKNHNEGNVGLYIWKGWIMWKIQINHKRSFFQNVPPHFLIYFLTSWDIGSGFTDGISDARQNFRLSQYNILYNTICKSVFLPHIPVLWYRSFISIFSKRALCGTKFVIRSNKAYQKISRDGSIFYEKNISSSMTSRHFLSQNNWIHIIESERV